MLDSNLNFVEFDLKYRNEWKSGNISEQSIDEIINILCNVNIDHSIWINIKYTIFEMANLLTLYQFSRIQSVDWIEPIRMDNWSLYTWYCIDPKVAEFKYDKMLIEGQIDMAFMKIYGSDNWFDIAGEDLIQRLTEEFSFKNLSSIDYIENYLKTYAKSKKVIRYLQKF